MTDMASRESEPLLGEIVFYPDRSPASHHLYTVECLTGHQPKHFTSRLATTGSAFPYHVATKDDEIISPC